MEQEASFETYTSSNAKNKILNFKVLKSASRLLRNLIHLRFLGMASDGKKKVVDKKHKKLHSKKKIEKAEKAEKKQKKLDEEEEER